jgi:N-glycosidase YbiA
MNIIQFYRVNDPYGWMSNFYPASITIGEKMYPTSEHYFQACKMVNTEDHEKMRAIQSPNAVAQEGRKRKYRIYSNWDNMRDDVMREALYAKFTQHEHLAIALKATGTSQLVEHTANDSYWADGGDGTGKNMLGILLMELRDKL